MNYLYNGVPLPNIDTVWTDKKTHPYAHIWKPLLTTAHEDLLAVVSVPFYAEDGQLYAPSAGTKRVYSHTPGQGWVERPHYGTEFEAGQGLGYHIIWSNYDIFNSDGSLCLAASEPIPVTAAEPLDPTSMLMGLAAAERRYSYGK